MHRHTNSTLLPHNPTPPSNSCQETPLYFSFLDVITGTHNRSKGIGIFPEILFFKGFFMHVYNLISYNKFYMGKNSNINLILF